MLDLIKSTSKQLLNLRVPKYLWVVCQLLLIGILSVKWAYAQTSIVESTAPAYVFTPKCCASGEFGSAGAAFSAAKAVYDQTTTQPGGAVVVKTAENFRPHTSIYNPVYNGVASLHASDASLCVDGQCSVNSTGGPGVSMSMRCPQDVVRINGGEYRFSIAIKGSGVSREASCERTIPVIPRANQCVGNPIIPATGEKIQVETDYKTADGLLEFTRTYRSIRGLSTSIATKKLLDLYNPSFASLACHSSWHTENALLKPVCFKYLRPLTQPQTVTYRMLLESGSILTFTGTSGQLSLNYGDNYSLRIYPDAQGKTEYELRTGRNHRDYFDSLGNLIRTINPSGKILTYSYSTDTTPAEIAPRAGMLIAQQDHQGRQLQFFYNSNEQMVKMTDPANKEYIYEYDGYNNLTAITYPGGARRQYFYGEPVNINAGVACSGSKDRFARLLTGITDEKGIRFADYKYNCDTKAASSEHAGGADKTAVTYNADGSVTVKNELNKNTIYRYTTVAGARLVSKVEGQPTANCAGANQDYTYTPEGWLKSRTDWKGVKTTYLYNSLGQETSRTEAFGTPEAKTIATEWHSTLYVKTKETEPGREIIYNYDENGNLLSQTVNSLTTP